MNGQPPDDYPNPQNGKAMVAGKDCELKGLLHLDHSVLVPPYVIDRKTFEVTISHLIYLLKIKIIYNTFQMKHWV